MPYDKSLAFERLLQDFEDYKTERGLSSDIDFDSFSLSASSEHDAYLAIHCDLHNAIANGEAIPLRLAMPVEMFERLTRKGYNAADKTSVVNWMTDSAVGEEVVRVVQLMAFVQSQWNDARQDVLEAAAHQIEVYAHG